MISMGIAFTLPQGLRCQFSFAAKVLLVGIPIAFGIGVTQSALQRAKMRDEDRGRH